MSLRQMVQKVIVFLSWDLIASDGDQIGGITRMSHLSLLVVSTSAWCKQIVLKKLASMIERT